MPHSSPDLARLAMTVLQPGFDGTVPPRLAAPGARRRPRRGRPVRPQPHRPRADGRTRRPAARARTRPSSSRSDEEGGAVTRLEASTGSSWPGNRALGVVDDVARTERVARRDRPAARRGGHHPELRARGRRQRQPGQPGDRRPLLRPRPRPRLPAHRGLGHRAAGRRGGRLRQALPRPRRHRHRLPPRAADRARLPSTSPPGARPAAVPRRDRRRGPGRSCAATCSCPHSTRRSRHAEPEDHDRAAPRGAGLRRACWSPTPSRCGAVAALHSPGEIAVRALAAGADADLRGHHLPRRARRHGTARRHRGGRTRRDASRGPAGRGGGSGARPVRLVRRRAPPRERRPPRGDAATTSAWRPPARPCAWSSRRPPARASQGRRWSWRSPRG